MLFSFFFPFFLFLLIFFAFFPPPANVALSRDLQTCTCCDMTFCCSLLLSHTGLMCLDLCCLSCSNYGVQSTGCTTNKKETFQKKKKRKEKKRKKKMSFSPHQGTVPMEPGWAHGRLPFTSCHLAWFRDLLYIRGLWDLTRNVRAARVSPCTLEFNLYYVYSEVTRHICFDYHVSFSSTFSLR